MFVLNGQQEFKRSLECGQQKSLNPYFGVDYVTQTKERARRRISPHPQGSLGACVFALPLGTITAAAVELPFI